MAPTKRALQNVLYEIIVTKGDLLAKDVKSLHVFSIKGAHPRLLLGRGGVTVKH